MIGNHRIEGLPAEVSFGPRESPPGLVLNERLAHLQGVIATIGVQAADSGEGFTDSMRYVCLPLDAKPD